MLNLGNILTVHGYKQVVGKPGTYADPDRYQSRDPNAMYTFFADMQGESEAAVKILRARWGRHV